MLHCKTACFKKYKKQRVAAAAPGMKGYKMPEARKVQIKQLKAKAKAGKKELLGKLDEIVEKLESNSKKDRITPQVLAKIDQKLEQEMEKRRKSVEALLANSNDFTRAFNQSKAFNPQLTQYEYKQQILASLNQQEFQKASEDIKSQLAKAGKMSAYLLDLKDALESNSMEQFLVSKDTKISRSIAYAVAPPAIFFIVIAIAAILMFASLVAGITLLIVGNAITLGLSLAIWPVGLLAVGYLGLKIYDLYW